MKKTLLLEDGREFEGTRIGAGKDITGKIVFTTGMCGFTEEISNPNNAGNLLLFTYPMVGGYGCNLEDLESAPSLAGVIIKELCEAPNNYRLKMTMQEFLVMHGISGIQGIDTRALTRHIRDNGSMYGIITSAPMTEKDKLIKDLKKASQSKLKSVTVGEAKEYTAKNPNGKRLAVVDYGVQKSMLNALLERGFNLTVVPNNITYQNLKALSPDGVILTSGQGNPEDFDLTLIKTLVSEKIPLLAVGLGSLLVALSQGLKTKKLHNGHRGVNHPVKDLNNNVVFATHQNHEYAVNEASVALPAKVTHINMHDSTIEGVSYAGLPIIAVQFQPETKTGYEKLTDIYGAFAALIK